MAKTKIPANYTKLGAQKMWCQVCDSRQVDSEDGNTGGFYKVFGLEHKHGTPPASVFFAICPHCKPVEAVIPLKSVADLLIREN
jgi:hypothetical protein